MNSNKLNTDLLFRANSYFIAVCAVALGSLLRYGLNVWVGPLPTYITFYPAVMLAALLGGFWPGILATVLVDGVVDYWLLPPVGFGIASLPNAVGLGLFSFMGFFMSTVAELYRHARVKAAAYDQEVALREIRRDKEFLAGILEHASQPFGVGYPDGRFGLINHAFEQLTGYTKDELKSIDWSRVLTPAEWWDIEQEKLEYLNRTGQPVRYEKEYIRKDGTRVPIELLVHRMTDLEGKPEYYYSFITDITERKQSEKSLRRAKEELELRVQDRTAELLKVNELLRMEIAERQKAAAEIYDLYNYAPCGYHSLDSDGTFVRMNDTELLWLGYSRDEIIDKKNFSDLLTTASQKIFKKSFPLFKERGAVKDIEFEMIRKDGTVLPVLLSATAVYDENGDYLMSRSTISDRTERMKAETAIRESEARFRSLIQTAPVVILNLSPEATILEFNPEAELVYGRTREEVLGKNYLDLFIKQELRSPMADRIKSILNGEQFFNFEMPLRHADGTQHYYLWNADRILDESEVPAGIIAVGYDITERKRLEHDLVAAAHYSRSLIEASLDPLVTISADGQIMDANGATERITGLLREQLIGSDFSDYFTEPDKARKGYQTVFQNGYVRDYPLVIKHTSGKTQDVLYNATVYRNRGGEIEGVFAAARDITKRKRAENRLRESKEQLRFLSSQLLNVQENERKRIASELHDNIAGSLSVVIMGLARVLRDLMKGSQNYEPVNSIISMIKGTVAETRRMMSELRPSMLDDLGLIPAIKSFLDQHETIYSDFAINRDITIEDKEIPENLKIVIYRIIQEGFANIVKHSNASTAELSLRNKNDFIELTITDNGKGYNPDTINTRNISSSGLGLVSIKERAKLSGGKLSINSAVDRGTTIFAQWPVGA